MCVCVCVGLQAKPLNFNVDASASATTHPNSDVDVVGVDLSPQVLADPLLAQELLEELGAVFQVVAADAPLPRLAVLDAWRVVARAPLHPARAAGLGQRVGQRGGGDGQQEGGLLECCVGVEDGGGASQTHFVLLCNSLAEEASYLLLGKCSEPLHLSAARSNERSPAPLNNSSTKMFTEGSRRCHGLLQPRHYSAGALVSRFLL